MGRGSTELIRDTALPLLQRSSHSTLCCLLVFLYQERCAGIDTALNREVKVSLY